MIPHFLASMMESRLSHLLYPKRSTPCCRLNDVHLFFSPDFAPLCRLSLPPHSSSPWCLPSSRYAAICWCWSLPWLSQAWPWASSIPSPTCSWWSSTRKTPLSSSRSGDLLWCVKLNVSRHLTITPKFNSFCFFLLFSSPGAPLLHRSGCLVEPSHRWPVFVWNWLHLRKHHHQYIIHHEALEEQSVWQTPA